MEPLRGIDVSDYQADTDWRTVQADGIAFAMRKATEGVTGTQRFYERDIAACRSLGIPVGSYHFFRPEDDGVAQAKHFLSVTGTRQPHDLPPALDFEVMNRVSAAQAVSRALDFLNYLKATGNGVPFIYSYGPFFTALYEREVSNKAFSDFYLWLADYQKVPKTPAGWTKQTLWQNGSTSRFAGVHGQCDTDLFYGTLTNLKAL